MTNMIERVELALVRRQLTEMGMAAFDADPSGFYVSSFSEKERSEFRSDARAAIEAMREPTPAMTAMAVECCVSTMPPDYFTQRSAEGCWNVMIDAALKPEVQP